MSAEIGTTVVLRRSSYSVQPEAAPAIKSALQRYLHYVRINERGTQVYLTTQLASNSNRFTHCAQFQDEPAFNLSQSSPAYLEFVEILRPVLIGDVHVERDDGPIVTSGGSRVFGPSDTIVAVKLTVMNRRSLPQFKKLLAAFTHRQSKGLLMSDAFVDPHDDLVYMIYERWVSQDALNAAIGGELRKELLALATLDIFGPVSFG